MTVTETAVPHWTLGERLRKARQHAQLEPEEMAKRMEVSRPAITSWENGKRNPRDLLDVIERWADITGVPVAWLLGLEVNQTFAFDATSSPLTELLDSLAS